MVPYLHSEMERSRRTHDPLIYPVFLKHPDYDPESDCFFCGDRVLACPVFDEGATAVTVTLPPAEQGWQLRGAGEVFEGGSSVMIPCLPEDEPVWFTYSGDKPF
jgi:alpha-glucosidase